jgi:tetratricopeptide (TPR) repeat protein
MMHSEFRRCYGTTGFFVDTTFVAGWKKRTAVDIDRDIVHHDLEFVDEFSEGIFYNNRFAWQKAIDHFQESARILGEDYSPLLSQMAICYYRLNQVEEAKLYFEKAIAVDSQCWEARLNLMRILRKEGKTPEAEVHKSFLMRETPWLAPLLGE